MIGPAPICVGCTHFRADGLRCAAFPDRIPDDILRSRVDHRMPYPDDHGVQFEPKTASDAEYAAQRFALRPLPPTMLDPRVGHPLPPEPPPPSLPFPLPDLPDPSLALAALRRAVEAAAEEPPADPLPPLPHVPTRKSGI